MKHRTKRSPKKYPRHILRGPRLDNHFQPTAEVVDEKFELSSIAIDRIIEATRDRYFDRGIVDAKERLAEERKFGIAVEIALREYVQYVPRREKYGSSIGSAIGIPGT